MARPVVGITAYVEQAKWGDWDAPAALLPYSYIRAVTRSGGRAVVLPPDEIDADIVGGLDALVLAGGADVEPWRYGADRCPQTYTRPDRDAGELTLLRAALDAGMPVLGVCRGMQLLVVAYGGRLHQHLPDALGHSKHRPASGTFGWHGVRIAPDSRAAQILGSAADLEVNSYHHQGVADPGKLRVTGWADDGLPEVVEDPERPFVLGVQWHPEENGDMGLFAAVVEAARPRERPRQAR